MIISRFSETASAACVLAKRWHRSVRMARRGAVALVQDMAADIGCEGWQRVAVSWCFCQSFEVQRFCLVMHILALAPTSTLTHTSTTSTSL